MSKFQNDSIFWIEVGKIKPNPYQPRREFSEEKLNYLADSIRQYGILQPLVVTRYEVEKSDGGLMAEYELIAGERRLRASKIAGLSQVPVIIRAQEEDDGVKLELAIIENLQREDLNPIDRAIAFQQLVDEFDFKHNEIAKKVGKSREYVSNTLRLLALPEEMKRAISSGQITEGHSRPLLMLKDRPEEQETLFKEIIYKRLTVRDAEAISRKVAVDKVRKKDYKYDPEIAELEGQLAESLGTRVSIEKKDVGGKVTIDFFSNDDLKKILDLFHSNEKKNPSEMLNNYIQSKENQKNTVMDVITESNPESVIEAEKKVGMVNEARIEESVGDILGHEPIESTESTESIESNEPIQDVVQKETNLNPNPTKILSDGFSRDEQSHEPSAINDNNEVDEEEVTDIPPTVFTREESSSSLQNSENHITQEDVKSEVITEEEKPENEVDKVKTLEDIILDTENIESEKEVEFIPDTSRNDLSEEDNREVGVPNFSNQEEEKKHNSEISIEKKEGEGKEKSDDDLYSVKDFEI